LPEPASVIDAASAFRVPTDASEADGTFNWDHTTLVVAETTKTRRISSAAIVT
jgi:hypothetical protein